MFSQATALPGRVHDYNLWFTKGLRGLVSAFTAFMKRIGLSVLADLSTPVNIWLKLPVVTLNLNMTYFVL